MNTGHRISQQGFTLIEVLVAFVLLSLTLAVILQIFSSGLRNIGAAEGYTRAMVLAEAKLAQLGNETALASGETGGEDDIFSWQLVVAPYQAESADTEETESAIPLYDVTLEIQWQQGSRRPRISFRTLRTGVAE